MQSGGYGGVSEVQQFMVDSCSASLFPISSAHPASSGATHPLKYHALPLPLQHPQPLLPPPQGLPPPHLAHFHSIPITQQLFHQTAAVAAATAHPFQLFHIPQQQYLPEPRRLVPSDQLALDQESAPENSASPIRIVPAGGGGGGQSFLAAAMRFNLGANDSSDGGGRSRKAIHDEDGILQGDDGSESRLHHWQREDESAINELPWRPLDIDYINRNNKRCNKDMEPETSNPKYPKRSKEIAEADLVDVAGGSSSNYKIFSELEAIYKPGAGPPNNQTTGSGSALTGDEVPLLHARAANVAAPGLPFGRSEMSAGDNEPTAANKSSMGDGRGRRKNRHRQLATMAAFFENLVKQLMDHQECLHQRLLDVMERREQERTSLEDAWRKQEAARSAREAAARAHDRALASSREGAIVAFIEKITGEALALPLNPHLPSADVDGYEQDTTSNLQIEPYDPDYGNNKKAAMFNNTSRWPKAEVQALIRVRSELESRFQEPGLKGPLWEEVSAAMVAIGCHRSAKRCKEKWENINKYFRKAKEKGKKRPHQSKTCPYFQQLDQLYSKSVSKNPNADATGDGQRIKASSELLDAIVVPADQQNFMFVRKEGDEEDAEQKEEGEELECEGENHGHENDVLHDPSLFFERLQS